MAVSVGQTVTEGLTSLADTVSSWLSGPLEDEQEPETPRRRAARWATPEHMLVGVNVKA